MGFPTAPAGWERLPLCRPRFYLRIILTLNHSLSCGELPKESQLPPNLREPEHHDSGGDGPARTASAARTISSTDESRDRESGSEHSTNHGVDTQDGAVRTPSASPDDWNLFDIGGCNESRDGCNPGDGLDMLDPSLSFFGEQEPVFEASHQSPPSCDTSWWTGSESWLRDLYNEIPKVA